MKKKIKNNDMNKLLKYLIFSCLGVAFFTSCLKQDDAICHSYVRFEYDYNLSYVDLFYMQASKVDLFMFDRNDIYIGVISQASSGATFDRNYRMQLPEGLDSDTKFIAWSGLYPESFRRGDMQQGVSTMDDLIVALNAAVGVQSDKDLHGLWYGTLENAEIRYINEVNTINMVKNTNNIRIVLQSLEGNLDVNVDDFDFTFTARNNSYDKDNAVADNVSRVYVPFYAQNDAATDAAVIEISTLRLMQANDNRLLITYDGQVEPILDINLNNYINALKLAKYGSMPLQEFMDREDEYKIIIFLSDGGGVRHFISSKITINEWIVRDQDDAPGN